MIFCPSASVYQRAGRLFLAAESQTVDGIWVVSPPFVELSEDQGPEAVGEALLSALGGSVSGVPTPGRSGNPIGPILELAGVRTWGAFVKGAKLLSVEEESGGLRLTPMHNDGRGFEFLADLALVDTSMGVAGIPQRIL